jgi:hypothetical protein
MRHFLKFGLIALVALALCSCGGGVPAFNLTSAKTDVAITHCDVMSDGAAVAQFVVTNHSAAEADYVTTVRFTIGHVAALSGPGFERGVAPGKSVSDQVVSTRPFAAGSKVRCNVFRVTRSPSTITTTT